LQDALDQAEDGDTIGFEPAFFSVPRTINLAGATLTITKAVTINGPGANLLTISGNNQNRVIGIAPSLVQVTLKNLTVTGGNAADGAGIFTSSRLHLENVRVTGNTAGFRGGGIFNNYQTVTLLNTTVSGNTANFGGGIYVMNQGSGSPAATGILIVRQSTVSGNTGNLQSGGLENNEGTTRIVNSTFSGNASNTGSAIFHNSTQPFFLVNSTVTANTSNGSAAVFTGGGFSQQIVNNSIVAGNIVNNGNNVGEIFGGALGGANNLIGRGDNTPFQNGVNGNLVGTAANPLNPRLKSLANNGGATLTHALETDSPARDAGSNQFAVNPATGEPLTQDQRGIARIINSTIDMGAVERYTISLTQYSLPSGAMNTPYNFTLQATGGVAPYSFAVTSGTLPNGLILQPNGQISGTPTESGFFEFTVTVTDSNPGSGLTAPNAVEEQSVQLQILAPTAANHSIGGRVSTADGRGIGNARVILTDSNGAVRTVSTSAFGYYRFDDLPTGETYVLQVASKRFTFRNPSRIVTLTEDLTDADFVAEIF
jgi:hypothetical protein